MKKFAGKRPTKEIIAAARRQGVSVDDYNYRKLGADHICLGIAMRDSVRPDGSPYVPASPMDGRAFVMYNTFNGRFWGATDKRIPFSSDSAQHEREQWFQALLSFFYVEKKEEAAPQKASTLDYTIGGARLLEKA